MGIGNKRGVGLDVGVPLVHREREHGGVAAHGLGQLLHRVARHHGAVVQGRLQRVRVAPGGLGDTRHLAVHDHPARTRGADLVVEAALLHAGVVDGTAVERVGGVLAHEAHAAALVFHGVNAGGDVQRAAMALDGRGVVHGERNVAQRQIDLTPQPGAVILKLGLRLGVLAFQRQLASALIGLGRAGVGVEGGIAAPERVLVQAELFAFCAAENHGAQPAVAQGQRLVPADRALPVPQRVRSVVHH